MQSVYSINFLPIRQFKYGRFYEIFLNQQFSGIAADNKLMKRYLHVKKRFKPFTFKNNIKPYVCVLIKVRNNFQMC